MIGKGLGLLFNEGKMGCWLLQLIIKFQLVFLSKRIFLDTYSVAY